MPYDEDLVGRLRELLAGEPDVTEKKMFGGLAFLLGGHMTVAASHSGGLLARVDPDEHEAVIAEPHTEAMQMGGRSMAGWVRVDAEGVADDEALATKVRRSVTFVRRLPPKSA